VPAVTDKYAAAGVDITAKNRSNRLVGALAQSTFNSRVISEAGFFNGMYELAGFDRPLLVSSTDSVGTKTKVAASLGVYDTVGIDIVNHCVNDIFTCGAKPLFFLDYIGIGRLVPERVEALVAGVTRACQAVDCVLIGGETAELSDVYHGDDYDLAGFIIGAVEKEKAIAGKAIREGDAVLGLPSSGLHTNGYTLARRIFGDTPEALAKVYPELGRPVGEVLLEPHRCYYNDLKDVLPLVRGLAHITGGGLIDNVPRVLPQGLAVRFDASSWPVPPVFTLMQRLGDVPRDEMYRDFNMGIGMVVVCAPENEPALRRRVPELMDIGEVVRQGGPARVVID
jgi:phosphoribosylformylglycinamidine cyclo-ligase